MRRYWPILILAPMLCLAQPGPWWAYGFGGPADDRFTAVAKGPGDTLYACGTFSGLMSMFGEQYFAVGVTDVFLVKLDTAGTVYWVATAGGPGVDRATDLAVDASGNIVVVGQFSGSFTAGAQTLASNGPSQDIFISKWAPTGEVLWARAAGSAGNTDLAEQVALDEPGNIYVAGQFSGAALFGGLSITSTFDPQTSTLGDDVFLAKYTAAGDASWVKKGAAIHQDQALGLAVDAVGNSWLAGQFSDVMTFDQPHPNAISNAGFVAAFDPSGAEQWFRRIGGGGSVVVGDLAFDAGMLWLGGSQSGNNIVFGNTNTAIASAFPFSAFALAFNAQGEVAAQRTVGSDHPIEARGIDARAGEVVLVGNFECQALELSLISGGDGLLLSWGPENGWICTLDQLDGLSITYAQVLVDHDAMDLRAVLFGEENILVAAGEFSNELSIPGIEGRLRALPGDSLVMIGPGSSTAACGDTTYYDVAVLRARGVVDGFIMKGFIRDRRPLDIFARPECEFGLHTVFDAAAGVSTCEVPGYEASFCGDASASASFDYDYGPTPFFLWNTGETTSGITVSTPGTYSATGHVGPGCFSGTDQVSIGLCDPVNMAGISDDQGVNFQDTLPETVVVCDPQQVTLTAGPVPGISFSWYSPEQGTSTDSTVTAEGDGAWYLTTTNADGCAAITTIQLTYLPSDTLVDVQMQQSLAFPQDTDGNDTITICAADGVIAQLSVELWLNGLQVGSPGTFIMSDTVFVNGTPADLGPFNMAGQPKLISTVYSGDGWYVYNSLMHITDGPCNDHFANDLWSDSIYVVGLGGGISQVDILGSIFLCSGQSVTLTAVANIPGSFEWAAENGGIIGPVDGTTLTLVVEGPVQVIFTPEDTSACTQGDVDTHSTSLVQAPTITMDPVDGLVCPGDPVELTVGGVNATYEWFGPGGPIAQSGATAFVLDPGTYFCVANTVEGCAYATALQTVSLYNTPYLEIAPQPVLCAGGSVVVSVQPGQGGEYAWSPPLSGNTSTQVITAPGTYSVSVTRCGIVTPLSFTITQSDPTASIVDEGPFAICPQDSVMLQAAPGLIAYVWQPGNLTGQQVYATAEGNYTLIGFDVYGCADTAWSAVVEVYDFLEPLIAAADTACADEATIATATGSGTFTWFADAGLQQPIGTGSPVTLGPFPETTTVYVTQTDATCTSWPIPVEAAVVPVGIPVSISGDTIVCIGTDLILHAAPVLDLVWDTPLGAFTGTTVTVPDVGTDASGLWTVTASLSDCAVGSWAVQVLVPDPQVAILDPGPFEICPEDSVALQATPGLASYLWSPGQLQGQIAYAQDTGHFSVVGTDVYGCTDTAGTVVVNGFFYTLALSATADAVCAGDTAIAIATGSGTITWYADPGTTQVLGQGSEWHLPGIAGPVTLYVTQAEAQCTSNPLAVPVVVIPLPPLPQILGDNTLCNGEPLQLIVSPLYAPQWSTPDGTIIGSLVSVDYATSALNGIYSVFYTIDGCPGPVASTTVSVVPLPLVDLGLPVTLCIGETTTVDAGPALTWLWSTGNTSQTITTGVPGTYWVTILEAGGCTDTDSLLITQDDCEVDIPNFITPNGDGVNEVLTLSSPSTEPLTLEIFNRWGQLLYSRSALVVQWDGRNAFSGEEVPEGVYYYVLTARLVNGEPLVRTGYLHVIR